MPIHYTFKIILSKHRKHALQICTRKEALALAAQLAGPTAKLEVVNLKQYYRNNSSNYILKFGELYVQAYVVEIAQIDEETPPD